MPEVQEPLLEQAKARRRVGCAVSARQLRVSGDAPDAPVLVDLEADVDVSLCGVVTRSRKEMADVTGDQRKTGRQLAER